MANTVLAKMAVMIAANTADFNKKLAESSSRMAMLQKTVASANTTLAGFGVGFGAFQVANVISNAIQSIAEFEKQLSTVKAITGATGKEFDALRQKALDLGRTTKFTSTQVAELQVAYGRLGFSTKEILDATEATLFLAAATGEDLAKSADVAGSTVRGFGLNADETLRVVDVMASSFNKSALSLENFTESMKYVAPIANAAGASVEETTALLGVLADAGVRGSQAGTSLRKIFTDMTKDGRPLKERLEELGKRGITLSDSFDEVGRTAQTALLILSKNTEKTDLLTESLRKSAGEAEKAARIMEDNLAGSFIKLSSAYDGAVQSSGPLTDGLRDIVDFTTRLINLSVSEGSGIFKFLNLLVSYTPNIVTISRLLGKLIPDVQTPLQVLQSALSDFNKENLSIVTDYTKVNKSIDEFQKMAEKAGVSIIKLEDNTGKVQVVIKPFTKTVTDGADALKVLDDAVKGYFPTIKELRDQKAALITQFNEGTDRTDQKELSNIGEKIIAIDNQIKKLDALRTAQKQTNNLKLQFLPDLEAEGSLNPELRNEQAANAAKEFSKELMAIGTSAEFAGGALVKLSEEGGAAFKEMAEEAINISGLLVSGIVDIASAFGEAAVTGAQDFGKAFIRSLGRFAQQFGALLIATGIGEKALKFGGPGAKIAAGVALVAIGGAISALMSQKPSLSGGGEGGSSFNRVSVAGQSFSDINITGRLYGEGSQLIAVIDNAKNSNGRRRA